MLKKFFKKPSVKAVLFCVYTLMCIALLTWGNIMLTVNMYFLLSGIKTENNIVIALILSAVIVIGNLAGAETGFWKLKKAFAALKGNYQTT